MSHAKITDVESNIYFVYTYIFYFEGTPIVKLSQGHAKIGVPGKTPLKSH
jgi:hypothetical protein